MGTLERVTDALAVLEELSAQQRARSTSTDAALRASDNGSIRFDEVDLVAPGGTCMASGLSLTVQRGEPLIVTGPNASGKSALFRTLGGLWRTPKGRIYRPCSAAGEVTPEDIFLVPQKPCVGDTSNADNNKFPDRRRVSEIRHTLRLASWTHRRAGQVGWFAGGGGWMDY